MYKNNLNNSSSPYLQQHKDNPIHWQEWSKEVLEYAKKQKKIIFVSIGYATCHWCHVMAREAFSNNEIATFLNDHFVAIKVDREQRPDIDQYFMAFLIEQQGHGGWPLNVICTADGTPFVGLTYVPITPQYGMPGFLDILKYAVHVAAQQKDLPQPFIIEQQTLSSLEEKELVASYKSHFNTHYGGFGHGPQFPPHNTLLFLFYYSQTLSDDKNQEHQATKKEILAMLEKTLDVMATRGLHDHVQGGFYRYCVDSDWTIPHFEKMLYDQALLLWIYSVAYKVFAKKEYKIVAEKIMQCLEETYQDTDDDKENKDKNNNDKRYDGLYYSGHDADTHHEEGLTYVWTKEKVQKILSPTEFLQFSSLYIVSETGNFEGKQHLIKNKLAFLPAIEKKLLLYRKKQEQPFVDKKKITSWNALLGIGFVHAWRFLDDSIALEKARNLFYALLSKHFCDGKLAHSSLGDVVQQQEFLEDYAALLLFATYLYEEDFSADVNKSEIKNTESKQIVELLSSYILQFQKKNNCWIESRNPDFQEIPAQQYDHPTPSSLSLVTFALARSAFLLGNKESSASAVSIASSFSYKYALAHDFFNLAVLFSKGAFHMIHAPSPVAWKNLSLHTIQAFGKQKQDCYHGKCLNSIF